MKKKIKVKWSDGTEVRLEKEIPAKDHLASQQKFRANVFRDKTKYTRKIKHKGKSDSPDA